MPRYIFYALFLCMYGMAKGQAAFDYRYWFDNERNVVHHGHSASEKWQMDVDVDGLNDSFHIIHVQIVDGDGVAGNPISRFFIKVQNTDIGNGYYWFDSERNKRQVSETTTGVFCIDVSHLTDGFHTVYYQVAVGEDSILSPVAARSFYKIAVSENLRYRCWIDDDRSTMMTGTCGDGPMLVDVSHVSDGVHVMYAQVEGTVSSSVVSRPFIKIPQTEGVDYLKCLCFVDDELYTEENLSADGGIINWDLDVTSLALGLHQIRIQVVTPSGAATATYEAEFERVMTDDEVSDRIHVTVGDDEAEGMSFRVDGVRAKTTDKGIIIRNGKKFLVK